METAEFYQNIGRTIRYGTQLNQNVIDRTIRRMAKYKARLREKKINKILK